MKIQPRCSVCLLQRGLQQIKLATRDPKLQLKVLKEIISLLAKELDENAVSAEIGTRRDRIIRSLTKCSDPYKTQKIKSNKLALELLPPLEASIRAEKDPYNRFRFAMLVAIVGNILEFDILEHSVDLENPRFLQTKIQSAEQDLVIDHSRQIFDLLRTVDEVLYLTDNAGEIVFDRLLIEEILKLGSKVRIAVKASPVLNDATIEDARVAGLLHLSEANPALQIITTGTDHVGLILNELSDPFRSIFTSAPFIIAKGMGYYETLGDKTLPQPIAYLFRIKCSTVAEALGVDRGKNIALLQSP
ncbi:MAG: damage-control phosphatase ARMT1 family protein [Candidatus Helarchaeota archaeon]